jgi:hypothetical protein
VILVLIQILITAVVGAILFWLIDRFIHDGRSANLLNFGGVGVSGVDFAATPADVWGRILSPSRLALPTRALCVPNAPKESGGAPERRFGPRM